MDRFRLYAPRVVQRPVLVDNKPVFETVSVPQAPVMVGGQLVTPDPVTERRQQFRDVTINGDVVAEGDLVDGVIVYAGKAKVHLAVRLDVVVDTENTPDEGDDHLVETVVGSMTLDQAGPFEVTFAADPE